MPALVGAVSAVRRCAAARAAPAPDPAGRAGVSTAGPVCRAPRAAGGHPAAANAAIVRADSCGGAENRGAGYAAPQREVGPAAPVERPQPQKRPRQSASDLIAPVARWGVRLGVAAAILTGLLVGAARVRPYIASLSAPSLGTIVIESSPPGSDVSIDGKPAGKTPFSTEVEVGRHVLEFRRKNLARTLEVDVAGATMTTSKLDWSAKPIGKLTVESDPTGAKVTIDGKLRGVTPLTLPI